MKNGYILLVLLSIGIYGCGGDDNATRDSAEKLVKDSVRLAGSGTVKPLFESILEKFLNKNTQYTGYYKQTGTPKGIIALAERNTDIAFASRDLYPSEDSLISKSGQFVSKLLAYEGISIIVNSKNKINQLKADEVRLIFSGKVNNWKQVGGDNIPITVLTRDTFSGTRKFFNEVIFSDSKFETAGLQFPIKDELVKKAEEIPGSIGYISGTLSTLQIKTLMIDFTGDGVYAKINAQNIKNGKYPLSRPFYCLYYRSHRKSVDDFINYLHTQESMEKIFAEGFIPLED